MQECNYQHNSASSSKYAYTLGDSGLIFSHFGLHVTQNVFNDHWISLGIFSHSLRVRSGCSASDRAEILMPQPLQANCNHDWSSSIHGDRWWNKRVWTSSWIKLNIIWEPRIWYSCWFYCCFTGLTVFLFPILGTRCATQFDAKGSDVFGSILNILSSSISFRCLDKSWCQSLLDDIAPL